MTKAYVFNQDDWHKKVPMVLQVYKTIAKKLIKKNPCNSFYVREVVVWDELLVPSLFVAQATKMLEEESTQIQHVELMELEEDEFLE